MKKIVTVLLLCFLISLVFNVYQFTRISKGNSTARTVSSILCQFPLDSIKSVGSVLEHIPPDSFVTNYLATILNAYEVDSRLISQYPRYSPTNEPPMPISSAISLSKKSLYEYCNNDSPWELKDIVLNQGIISGGKYYRDCWKYVVSYSRHKGKVPFDYYECKRIPVYFGDVKVLQR